MKYTLLIIAILTGTAFTAHAQNWACFYPNDTMYYLDNGGKFRAIAAIDSTVGSGSREYTIYGKIGEDDNCNEPSPIPLNDPLQGYSTQLPIWAGATIKENAGGEWLFYNEDAVSIKVLSAATVNNAWLFFSAGGDSILATVTAVSTDTFMDVIDSVKTIQLTVPNANADSLVQQWDGKSIRLSATYGLIEAPQFLSFPVDTALFRRTMLKPLTWGEVYNFSVGDYFQIKRESYLFVIDYSDLNFYQVIDKQPFPAVDSVTYTFYHESKTGAVDTVIKTYTNLSKTIGGGLPEAPVLNSATGKLYVPEMFVTFSTNLGLNGRRAYSVRDYDYLSQSGLFCWYENGIPEGGYFPTTYECLGELMYLGTVDGYYQDRLVYYNLCGQQGGAKLTVGIPELPEAQVKIYPNPANNLLQIDNASNMGYTITIANLQGQVVHTLTATGNTKTSIDVSDLALGVYIIRLDDGAKAYFKKVVIAR